jgi:hypothetical protein
MVSAVAAETIDTHFDGHLRQFSFEKILNQYNRRIISGTML